MPDSPPHTWISSLGYVPVSMTLSRYRGGQPRLRMGFADGQGEDLTIEVPGFDLRAYDADYRFERLHAVFRSPERASLLAGCEIVNLTPYRFRLAETGRAVLQLVWLQWPAAWSRHPEETLVP